MEDIHQTKPVTECTVSEHKRAHHEDQAREIKRLHMEVEQLREKCERLERLSLIDALTGLQNDRYFHHRLDEELERAARHRRQLSIAFLRVDNLDRIADEHGNDAPELIFQQASRLIRYKLRNTDVLTRYGKEELAAILPDTKLCDALMVAERIRKAIHKSSFLIPGKADQMFETATSISVGISTFPEHSRTREGLIVASDVALSSAMKSSGNQVSSYTPVQCGAQTLDPYEYYQLIHDPSMSSVISVAAAIDAKDGAKKGHSQRVSKLAVDIAKRMGLRQEEIDRLRIAGLVHDIGTLGIPDWIYLKPGGLNPDERKAIEELPLMSKSILEKIPNTSALVPIILHHHERWDGTGYPDKLVGEEIPITSRILAVADAFDAMTTDRPYRRPLTTYQAIEELDNCSGAQFDARVVDEFVQMIRERSAVKRAA